MCRFAIGHVHEHYMTLLAHTALNENIIHSFRSRRPGSIILNEIQFFMSYQPKYLALFLFHAR